MLKHIESSLNDENNHIAQEWCMNVNTIMDLNVINFQNFKKAIWASSQTDGKNERNKKNSSESVFLGCIKSALKFN